MATPMRVLMIPQQGGDDPIAVPSNELPADADELAEVLVATAAHLGVWMEFIAEYARQAKYAQMEKLISWTAKRGECRARARGTTPRTMYHRLTHIPRAQTCNPS
jgi:hypothetical protein